MSVHRTTPLPERPALGHLIVPESVIWHSKDLLRQAGEGQPSHEGLVWWFGRQVEHDTLVLSCHRPSCRSGPDFVFTDEAASGSAGRLARACRLGVVAQVHSHPGADTRHSDGDDSLILMPFEGMFSAVIGDYGHGGMHPYDGAGLHQFQDGRWVLVSQSEPALIIVPTESTA